MDNVALRIACCIERARIESGLPTGWPPSDAETYWYTREAAPSFSRKLGIPYPKVVSALNETNMFVESKVFRLSEPFWPDLAHPLLILKEVMES
jgi:hypothetical protein